MSVVYQAKTSDYASDVHGAKTAGFAELNCHRETQAKKFLLDWLLSCEPYEIQRRRDAQRQFVTASITCKNPDSDQVLWVKHFEPVQAGNDWQLAEITERVEA